MVATAHRRRNRAAGETTLGRLVAGSHRHAVRRMAEMAAAADMLTGLGAERPVTGASRDLLQRLARTAG